MATVVIKDMAEEAAIQQDQNGWTATRSFLVHDMEGSAEERVSKVLDQSEIPKIGDNYPARGTLTCVSRSVQVVNTTTYRVIVQYNDDPMNSGSWKISLSGSTIERQVNANYKGVVFQTLQPTAAVDTDKRKYSLQCEKIAPLISVMKPQLILTASKRVKIADWNPYMMAQQFIGKTNANDFTFIKTPMVFDHKNDSGDPPGYAAGNYYAFLCTRLTSEQVDPERCDVTIELQFDEHQWFGKTLYIDRSTNLPIPKGDKTNGCANDEQIYDSVDFSPLGIGA